MATIADLDRDEQLTRIEKMLTEIRLNQSQVKKVDRDYYFMPITVAIASIAAGGGLVAAGAAIARLYGG